MRGLMAKEMTGLLGLYKKNLLLVGLVYGGLSIMTENSFFLYFGVWMMGFYSLSGYSLDEQSGWGRYARTLPISDFQVVAAKFVAAGAFMGIGTANPLVVAALILLVVAAVLGICLAVSVSLYRKKEF